MLEWKETLGTAIEQATRDAMTSANTAARMALSAKVYLYYLPARSPEWGHLIPICPGIGQAHGDALLADPQPIQNGAMTREQVRARVREIARRLPIIGD